MEAPFLAPLHALPWLKADFVGRIASVPGTTDREATLAELEPHHRRRVDELGFDWQNFRRAEQVHDRRVALAGRDGSPAPHPKADALVTAIPGLLLGIYVADCAAVYLADLKNHAIGLAHSGKRGTELRMVPETIEAMRDAYGTQPEDLLVVNAPCIRPPHYDVDFARSIRQQALGLGVPEHQYHDTGICTASELDCYYSYRTEKGATGRMLALLGICGT